jgi:hypothetical protein
MAYRAGTARPQPPRERTVFAAGTAPAMTAWGTVKRPPAIMRPVATVWLRRCTVRRGEGARFRASILAGATALDQARIFESFARDDVLASDPCRRQRMSGCRLCSPLRPRYIQVYSARPPYND